jgi:hypothetical protein
MPDQPPTVPAPDRPAPGSAASEQAPAAPSGPGVLTVLICEQCGNEHLIRVKGCWYCEKCHYKFDCYGW